MGFPWAPSYFSSNEIFSRLCICILKYTRLNFSFIPPSGYQHFCLEYFTIIIENQWWWRMKMWHEPLTDCLEHERRHYQCADCADKMRTYFELGICCLPRFFFERIRVHKKWKQVERYIASYRSVCVCGGGVIVEIYLRSKWMDFFSPRHTYTYSRSQTRFHLCPRRFTMIVQREIFEKLMFAEYRDVSSSLCANFPSLNCAMCTDYFKFVS